MKFDLVTNLPTTNCLIYIDKFRFEDARGYQTSYTYFGKSGTTAMKAGSATWTWTNSSDTCVLSRPSEALTTFSRWLFS